MPSSASVDRRQCQARRLLGAGLQPGLVELDHIGAGRLQDRQTRLLHNLTMNNLATHNAMAESRVRIRRSALRATGTASLVAIEFRPTREQEFMKILMVLTSHDKLGSTGRKTGFWLEEFAAPYYTFKEAGAEIVVASPKGGQPPLDPKRNEPTLQTELTHRFERKSAARDNTGSLGCWRQPERADRL